MVHRLSGIELRNGRQHSKGISRQKENIFWLRTNRRFYGIINKVNGICYASIFCFLDVVIINRCGAGEKFNVLYQCSKTNGIKNLRFFFFREVNAFSITSSFKIKYALVAPTVLVIANQLTVWVSRKRCLSGTR